MRTSATPAPTGRNILVMLAALIALLALMVSGSKLLIGAVKGALEGWPLPVTVMLLLGILHGVLAWGLRRGCGWLRWYAPGLLAAVVLLALLVVGQARVLDLAAVLVFTLAALVNMAVIAWCRLAAFAGGAEGAGPGDGTGKSADNPG